ncbi:MAG: hypothetical protein AAGK02_01500 [Pseudomonadota bacterium]
MSVSKLAIPLAIAAALAGCSTFITVTAYAKDGDIWFENPNDGLFTADCVTSVEITERVGQNSILSVSRPSDQKCLATLPFKLGEIQPTQGPTQLVAGRRYDIFIEISGGAGDGEFRIEEDGSITNIF